MLVITTLGIIVGSVLPFTGFGAELGLMPLLAITGYGFYNSRRLSGACDSCEENLYPSIPRTLISDAAGLYASVHFGSVMLN